MLVKVYFESKVHAEVVAYFVTEEMYDLCFPALEEFATKYRMRVTESIEDDEKEIFV